MVLGGISCMVQKAFKELKKHKNQLTKQQYRTIKGQLIAGDITGGMRGLNRLLNKKVIAGDSDRKGRVS